MVFSFFESSSLCLLLTYLGHYRLSGQDKMHLKQLCLKAAGPAVVSALESHITETYSMDPRPASWPGSLKAALAGSRQT